MASSSEEGRIILYYQQIKREHQYLKKKTEQFAESLRKVDAMYEAMLEHELRMNDMNEKLTALTEDNNTMKILFQRMGSENHERFEKMSQELQSLSHKVLRLDTLEKEHGTRVHNNGILLRDIQYKLAELETAVEDSSKFKGKVTKHPDHPEIGRLAKEVESLRGVLYDQNKSVKRLRQDFEEQKEAVQHGGRGISQATARTRELDTQPRSRPEPETQGTAQPQTPTTTAAKKPVKRSHPAHSARLSKKQIIISPKGSKMPTLTYVTSGPAKTPSLVSETGSRGLSMARRSSRTDSPVPMRLLMPKVRSPISKAPIRRSQRIGEKHTRQTPSQPQMDTIVGGHGNVVPTRSSSQRPLMVHMNQSYPHIQGLLRSSESSDVIGSRAETEQQRARSRLTVRKQDQGYQNAPAESSAQDEDQPRKPRALVPQPRRRKKRELPPMNPLPPYEE